MIIHFMRHGETTGDIENRYGGDYEDHLTARGREQVAGRIPFFQEKSAQRIFSSPRIRAQESASILSEALSMPVEVMDGWRERNAFGVLTGVKKSVAQRSHPEVVNLLKDHRNTAPGAESYEHFKLRLAATLDITVHQPYDEVIVVTHTGIISCFLREHCGKELQKIADVAIVTAEVSGDRIELLAASGAAF